MCFSPSVFLSSATLGYYNIIFIMSLLALLAVSYYYYNYCYCVLLLIWRPAVSSNTFAHVGLVSNSKVWRVRDITPPDSNLKKKPSTWIRTRARLFYGFLSPWFPRNLITRVKLATRRRNREWRFLIGDGLTFFFKKSLILNNDFN